MAPWTSRWTALEEDSVVDIAGWRFYTGQVLLYEAAAAPD